MGEIAMVNKPTPARTFRENLRLRSTLDSVQPWDIDDSPWIYAHLRKADQLSGADRKGSMRWHPTCYLIENERCQALVSGCMDGFFSARSKKPGQITKKQSARNHVV
jgi:hypothetical protein